MVAQVAASGNQVWAAACCGVRAGGWLVAETQRGSISPMRIRSPFAPRGWRGTIGKRYVDLPGDGARGGVAPEEGRGSYVRRDDGPIGWIIDNNGDGIVLREGRGHTQTGKNYCPEQRPLHHRLGIRISSLSSNGTHKTGATLGATYFFFIAKHAVIA